MRHTKRVAVRERPRVGRPPAGSRGDRISDYVPLTLRVPAETRDLLAAIVGMTGMPIWKAIDTALAEYVRRLPPEEQKVLTAVRRRRARRDA
jgi:hypothetical protein